MNKLLVVGLVVCLFLAGCGAQELYYCKDGSIGGGQEPTSSRLLYYCPDGTRTTDLLRCDFDAPITIKQDDAEDKAQNFVEAYTKTDGWSTRLINAYKEDGRYLAQLVLSKRDEAPYETLVVVNGQNGVVSCFENCEYTEG
jgi:hypothetical protein